MASNIQRVSVLWILRLLPVLLVCGSCAVCSASASDVPAVAPSFYWSRTLPAHLSHLRSHIGPVPHLNTVLTEWSNWGAWSMCSRSCNTGVRLRTRHCITSTVRVMPGSGVRTSHAQCGGASTQYDSCGRAPCPLAPAGGSSFRAAQCRRYNNREVFGRVVTRWLPYTQGSVNPCALVCEGEGEGIVYTFGKVTDGTQCSTDEGHKGLCVNGRCLRISCDGRLGGSAQEDQCRVCGGRNTTCTLHKGVFHTPSPPSYFVPSVPTHDPRPFLNGGGTNSLSRTSGSADLKKTSWTPCEGSQVCSTKHAGSTKQLLGDENTDKSLRLSSDATLPERHNDDIINSLDSNFPNSKYKKEIDDLSRTPKHEKVGNYTQFNNYNYKYDTEKLAADEPATTNNPDSIRKGSVGYYEVTFIPKGATNLRVTDTSHNFLALREGSKYLLNGDWLIDWPGEIEAAGAVFSYSRAENDSEALVALGPTKDDLHLMILLREDNPGVYYEYWTPNTIGSNGQPINFINKSIHSLSSSYNSSKGSQTSNHSDVASSTLPLNMKPDNFLEKKRLHPTKARVQNRDELRRTSPRAGKNTKPVVHSQPKTRIAERKHHQLTLPSRHSHRYFSDTAVLDKSILRNPLSHRGKISKANNARNHFLPSLNSGRRRIPAANKARVKALRSHSEFALPDSTARLQQASHSSGNNIGLLRVTPPAVRRRNWRRRHSKRGPVTSITSTFMSQESRDYTSSSSSHRRRRLEYNNRDHHDASIAIGRKQLSSKKAVFRKRKTRKKRKRKRRMKKKTRAPAAAAVCSKCPPVRNVKKHFCTSDFVSRVEVLSFEPELRIEEPPTDDLQGVTTLGGRYEVTIHQSFKNTVPLLHKEFLWVPNYDCVCPSLRPGKMYLIMGKTKSSGKGREVRLGLDSASYTRRFNTRVLDRVLDIRNNEMKYCNKFRKKPKDTSYFMPLPPPINETNNIANETTTLSSFVELNDDAAGAESPSVYSYKTDTDTNLIN